MEGVQDDVGGLVLGRKRASVDVFDFLKFILKKEGKEVLVIVFDLKCCRAFVTFFVSRKSKELFSIGSSLRSMFGWYVLFAT